MKLSVRRSPFSESRAVRARAARTRESRKRGHLGTSHLIRLMAVLGFAVMGSGVAPGAPQATETPPAVSASTQPWWVSLRYENDIFGGSDQYYTNGASIAVVRTGRSWLDAVADRLPWGDGRRSIGYDFGQIIATPTDITRANPDPRDRPYAGILYFGISLHVDRGNRYDGLRFITGVVGPWSGAEQTQRLVHRAIGSPRPQGWSHQLHNEPIGNLVYEHRRKYRLWGEKSGLAIEALPAASVMLGNVLTLAQAGGQLRFGYNIPDDFGTTLMRGMGHLPPPRQAVSSEAPPHLGGYLYGGLHANLVWRNITMDGNTWRDSPSVEKDLFVPATEVGAAVATQRYIAAFSYVFWGREFKDQPKNSQFGAFTLTRIF